MKNIFILTLSLLMQYSLFAQERLKSKKEIDPSKPTNLYTQINANLEYRSGINQNLYGLKTNVQYAFNPDNLLMLELPMLYNDQYAQFGISDVRVRYFNAIKRNLTKTVIAIAPFADITLPTGNFEKGLGSSSWTLSAGCVVGLRVSKKLSFFPVLERPVISSLPDTKKSAATPSLSTPSKPAATAPVKASATPLNRSSSSVNGSAIPSPTGSARK